MKETIAAVRASAARHGRKHHVRFSLSLRPVLGHPEAEAWSRADRIMETTRALRTQAPPSLIRRVGGLLTEAAGAKRLQATVAQGRVVDKRLWTEIAGLNGGGNSIGLVGTPERARCRWWITGILGFRRS